MTRIAVTACLLGLVLVPATSQAQNIDHLEVLQAPQLVDCSQTQPYFRVVINAVDAERKLAALGLSQDQAKTKFQVLEGDRRQRAKIWYVGLSEGGDSRGAGNSPGTYVLLLLDTSGSMRNRLSSGESRFTEAKSAIGRSLTNFTDGSDHIAVVPFNSRNVASQIRGATFQTTRQGVMGQVAAIPPPQANTALYTAMAEALPILKARSDAGAAVSLVVFSDGENDVDNAGDDRGLLGPEGLAKVKELAAQLKVPITTVGFGVSRNAALVSTLQELAWPNGDNFYNAETNPQRLGEIFAIARRKLTDRIQILFQPAETDREKLTGQTVPFLVGLTTTQGQVFTRSALIWSAPAVGVPVFETTCTEAELRSLPAPVSSGPIVYDGGIFRRLGVLAIFSALLAGLWFGAPRFVWPESYIPKPPVFNRPSSGIAEVDAIRAPTFSPSRGSQPSMPPSRGAPPVAPTPRGGPSMAPRQPRQADPQTIVIPPRSAPRPAGRISPQVPDPPVSRDVDDETIYRPRGNDPKKDR